MMRYFGFLAAVAFVLMSFQLGNEIWIMTKGGGATYSTTLKNGETIEGTCKQVSSIFTVNEKKINITIPLAAFKFKESGLLEQFIGKDYINTSKASESIVFNGTIPDADPLKFEKEQEYKVAGELIIADKAYSLLETISIVKIDDMLKAHISFKVDLKNYGIELDDATKQQLGETFALNCDLVYETVKIQNLGEK